MLVVQFAAEWVSNLNVFCNESMWVYLLNACLWWFDANYWLAWPMIRSVLKPIFRRLSILCIQFTQMPISTCTCRSKNLVILMLLCILHDISLSPTATMVLFSSYCQPFWLSYSSSHRSLDLRMVHPSLGETLWNIFLCMQCSMDSFHPWALFHGTNSSIGVSSLLVGSSAQILTSILSVVRVGSCTLNHGGDLEPLQQVPSHCCPSQRGSLG